jgi:hypothetical protein
MKSTSNRYFYRFYRHFPPRPLKEIDADILAIELDIVRMLAEVTGSNRLGNKCRRMLLRTNGLPIYSQGGRNPGA